MDKKKSFKELFNRIAKLNGFIKAFSGWYQESNECIVTLELQRSNYSNLYYLNIKVFIQGANNLRYKISKDLIFKEFAHADRREPPEYQKYFDLENNIDDIKREEGISKLFIEFLNTFTKKALTREGVFELRDQQLVVFNIRNL